MTTQYYYYIAAYLLCGLVAWFIGLIWAARTPEDAEHTICGECGDYKVNTRKSIMLHSWVALIAWPFYLFAIIVLAVVCCGQGLACAIVARLSERDVKD